MNYTEARLKLLNGTIIDCRLENDETSFYFYRKDAETTLPTRAVSILKTTYKAGGIKSEFWDFVGWEDVLKDRIVYGDEVL